MVKTTRLFQTNLRCTLLPCIDAFTITKQKMNGLTEFRYLFKQKRVAVVAIHNLLYSPTNGQICYLNPYRLNHFLSAT